MTKTTIRKPYLVAIIAGVLLAGTTFYGSVAFADDPDNDVVILTCVIFLPDLNVYVIEVTGSVDVSGIPESVFVGGGPPNFSPLSNCALELAGLQNLGFVIDNVAAQPRAPAFGVTADGTTNLVSAFGMHNVYTLVRQNG